MSRSWLLAAVLVGAALASCAAGEPSATAGAAPQSELRVSAAASLTDAFAALEREFEAGHPAVDVVVNPGPSDALAAQTIEGAPAHVVAFADESPMRPLVEADLLGSPVQVFASNRLVVVVPTDNPEGLSGLTSLPEASVVSLCATSAPCGRYADRWLSSAGVTLDEASTTRGRDARATLSAVADGDADAAIVYTTDAHAARERVEVVASSSDELRVRYPIAQLRGAPPAAGEFVQLVRSDTGRRLLRSAGFGPP